MSGTIAIGDMLYIWTFQLPHEKTELCLILLLKNTPYINL